MCEIKFQILNITQQISIIINNTTSKEDRQKNKLHKQSSKFPSKTDMVSVSLFPTLNNVQQSQIFKI